MTKLGKQAAVRAVLKYGRTQASVAKDAGVARSTLQKWLREEREKSAEEEPPPVDTAPIAARAKKVLGRIKADSPEDERPDASTDTLESARQVYRDAHALAADARKQGNLQASQRAMNAATQTLTVISRLEKMRSVDEDTLHFSRREIDEAMARVLDNVSALVSRPLLCAECGRALSVHLAKRDAETEDGE